MELGFFLVVCLEFCVLVILLLVVGMGLIKVINFWFVWGRFFWFLVRMVSCFLVLMENISIVFFLYMVVNFGSLNELVKCVDFMIYFEFNLVVSWVWVVELLNSRWFGWWFLILVWVFFWCLLECKWNVLVLLKRCFNFFVVIVLILLFGVIVKIWLMLERLMLL